MEVTETETATFETEISEDDLHAIWKLKGEMLHPSAVRVDGETRDRHESEKEVLDIKSSFIKRFMDVCY